MKNCFCQQILPVLFYAVILSVTFTPNAYSAESQATLTLIGFTDAVEESNETFDCVQAGISDLDAQVQLVWQPTRPRQIIDGLNLAKSIATTYKSLAVFWRVKSKLYLYVPKLDADNLLIRPIGSSQEEGSPDTVGLIVRGALGSLLSSGSTAPAGETASDTVPQTESSTNDGEKDESVFTPMPEISETETNEENPDEDDISSESSDRTSETSNEKEDKDIVKDKEDANDDQKETNTAKKETSRIPAQSVLNHRLLAEGLYGLDVVSNDTSPLNVGRVTLGIRLLGHVFVTADFSYGQPISIRAPESGGQLTMDRYLMSLSLRAYFFERGRWQLGGGAHFEVNLISEDITSEDETLIKRKGVLKTQLGLVPSGYAGFQLIGPLYATLHLGMRILLWEKTNYKEDIGGKERIFYEPWRVQLRLSFGLKIFFF